jgi:amino acid efflux transporter
MGRRDAAGRDAAGRDAAGGRLTALQGTALYTGAVLGTGIIALPALAAKVAGPASLLSWLGLAIVSAPLAATFAALGARYPDSGGVATYARLAFGDRAANVVGWCFFFAIPVGAPAAALWVGAYMAAATHGGAAVTDWAAIGLLIVVPLGNAFGVKLTGRVQLILGGVLVTFLLAAIGLSLRSVRTGNLHPFAPHGWLAIGSAAELLVWCFVGWEVVSYLTAEFRNPARDVPRATAVAVVVVGALYLAVAFVTIAVLGRAAAGASAPLADLLARGLGGNGKILAAAAALLLTLGAANAYYAGTARLGAALGRDGGFPAWLAHGSQVGEVPRRSLGLLSALSLGALLVDIGFGVGTQPLVLMATSLFVTVYAVGVVAAIRLLPRGKARASAVAALVFVAVLLVMSGPYLVYPLLVSAGALIYHLQHRMRGKRAGRPASGPATLSRSLGRLGDLVQEGDDVRHHVSRTQPRPAELGRTQFRVVKLAAAAEHCHQLVEEHIHFFLVISLAEPGRAEPGVLDPFDQVRGPVIDRDRRLRLRAGRGTVPDNPPEPGDPSDDQHRDPRGGECGRNPVQPGAMRVARIVKVKDSACEYPQAGQQPGPHFQRDRSEPCPTYPRGPQPAQHPARTNHPAGETQPARNLMQPHRAPDPIRTRFGSKPSLRCRRFSRHTDRPRRQPSARRPLVTPRAPRPAARRATGPRAPRLAPRRITCSGPVSGRWSRTVVQPRRSPAGAMPQAAAPGGRAGGRRCRAGAVAPFPRSLAPFPRSLAPLRLPLHPYPRVDAAFVRFCPTVKGARDG